MPTRLVVGWGLHLALVGLSHQPEKYSHYAISELVGKDAVFLSPFGPNKGTILGNIHFEPMLF